MTAPLPRFATRVGDDPRALAWAWPLTVALHAAAAAALAILPLLGIEPLPPENDRVANAFFAFNGVPTSIVMTVTVNFLLRGSARS